MIYKNSGRRIAAALICAGIMMTGCGNTPETENAVGENIAGSAGTSAVIEYSESLALSHKSGFYDADFTLAITAPEGAKIYYTTDGSIPDESDTLYTQPLTLTNRSSEANILSAQKGTSAGGDFIPKYNVDKANVIRAIAVLSDGTKTEIVNGTYWIGINRESEYGSVPVISIMTDMENLYGHETGIYILGKTYEDWKAEQEGHYEPWQAVGNYSNKGREWERPASFELITADGSKGFSQDMGIRIMGAASRSATQKSFRVTAREDYGKKALEYKLIPDNIRSDGTGEVEKYKSFVIRNGGNDCDYAKIRDPLFQKLASDRRFDTMASTPCVVYLNGEYWGAYTIAEDYSDNYIENNYGIDNKNVVIVKRGEIEEGEDADIELYNEMYDFIVSNDMTVAENYEKACGMLDMGGYIDSCALNFYIDNEDCLFDNNNWQMWRVRTPDDSHEFADGKWRMLVYDTDFSAGIYNEGANYKKDNITEVLSYIPENDDTEEDDEENARDSGEMFRALYSNPDFKRELVTAMCDLRNVNFETKNAVSELLDMMDVYKIIVPDTFNRFGPDWLARQNTENYYNKKLTELANYLDGRYRYFTDTMQKAMGLGNAANVTVSVSDSAKGTIIVNNSAPDLTEEFTGKYFTDYPITVTAVPADGCTFTGWECSGAEISDASAETAEITFTGDFTLKANFS